MKRLTALILTLLICLVATPALAAETYTAQGLFSFDYPDGWTFDDTSYLDENDDHFTWITDVYGDGLRMVVYKEKVDGWEEFTLAQADQATAEEYRQNLIEAYTGSYLNTLVSQNGEIPFVELVTSFDEYEYLYAVTMLKGEEIVFYLSAEEGDALTDPLKAVMEQVIESFQLFA